MTARVNREKKKQRNTWAAYHILEFDIYTGRCKCDDDLLNVIFILCGNLFFRVFLFDCKDDADDDEEEKNKWKSDRHRLIYIKILSHIEFFHLLNSKIEKKIRNARAWKLKSDGNIACINHLTFVIYAMH